MRSEFPIVVNSKLLIQITIPKSISTLPFLPPIKGSYSKAAACTGSGGEGGQEIREGKGSSRWPWPWPWEETTG